MSALIKRFANLACSVTIGAGIAFFAFSSVHAAEGDDFNASSQIQESISSVYNKNCDAIVKVTSEKSVNGEVARFSASGFLSSKDGYVLTSAFVAHAAEKIWVEWKGLIFEAESIGYDPITTAAVIKIKGDFKSKNANFVKINSSASLPKIATALIAISREMGLDPSPRLGLVAGHDISFGDVFLPTVYIRSNIPSYSGSIGGAVFDLSGKFIGMSLASVPATGGSFILPARALARIRDDIILCSEPVYGWFGLQASDTENKGEPCVEINMVIQNSPATKAGFKVGDIIWEINSERVRNNTELRNATFFIRPNETARFSIIRNGEVVKLELLVEKMDAEIIKSAAAKLDPKPINKAISTKSENLNEGSQKNDDKAFQHSAPTPPQAKDSPALTTDISKG